MLIINNKKGFTLIEIIIAAGVLVGAIVLMVAGVNAYFESIQIAKDTAMANYASQTKMEEIRNFIEEQNVPDRLTWVINYYNGTFNYATFSTTSPSRFNPFALYDKRSYTLYERGLGIIQIKPFPDPPAIPQMLNVRISVCWLAKGTKSDPARRIVGEDVNLNGVLDLGEDKDADGLISSPVQLESSFTVKW